MEKETIGDLAFLYESKSETYIDQNEIVWCYDNVTIISSLKYEIGKQFEQLSIGYKYNQTGMEINVSFETTNGIPCNGY